LNFMNNPQSFAIRGLVGLIFAAFFISPAISLSQEVSPDDRVTSAAEILVELDNRAERCLDSLETTSPDEPNQVCDAFLEAIDGDILTSYLSHCEELKTWREGFITSSDTSSTSTEENLQRLIGIEFTCGENALEKRTQYVFSAFNKIQQSETVIRASNISARSISELKFESTLNQNNRTLQNSILQQRLRLEIENQKLQNDIEKELIRQQISNPSGAFQHRRNPQ